MKQILHTIKMGVVFSIFGSICMLGNCLFVPIVLLGAYKIKAIRYFSRDCVFYAWRVFVYVASIFKCIKVSYNIESAPMQSIIIANHPSLLDIVLLVARFKRANCVVKRNLANNIFLCGAIRASGYIVNRENEITLNEANTALNDGECLIIFPEGTRSNEKIVFHKAAAYIAINAAKVVLPVFIKMSPRGLNKGDKWYRTPNMCYEITSGEMLYLEQFHNERPKPIRARLLHESLRQIYKKEFHDEFEK